MKRFGIVWVACVLALSLIGSVTAAASDTTPSPQVPVSDPAGDRPLTPTTLDLTDALHEQFEEPTGNGPTSQLFDPANSPFDNQAADDFVVAGEIWEVERLEVISSGGGAIVDFNVFIYADDDGLPGATVYEALNETAEIDGDLWVIQLTEAAVLVPGKYWLSVQAIADFYAQGQWFWANTAVQTHQPAAWRNPPNGFGKGCIDWTAAGGCDVGGGEGVMVDLLFGIYGTRTPVVTTTPETLVIDQSVGKVTSHAVTVENHSDEPVTWHFNHSCVGDTTGWFTASPTTGTLAAGGEATITLRVNTIGLDPGSYSATPCVGWDEHLAIFDVDLNATDVIIDRFLDVPEGSLFDPEIHWLARNGITRGCNPPTNTNYCPDASVTRGQMAAFLNRALDLTPAGAQGLTDIADSVFTNDVNALFASGITRGCNPPTNDRFCPDQPVTRGQMAAFLYRALRTTG